jgi:hypothetical protein
MPDTIEDKSHWEKAGYYLSMFISEMRLHEQKNKKKSVQNAMIEEALRKRRINRFKKSKP